MGSLMDLTINTTLKKTKRNLYPRFRNIGGETDRKDFLRGYGYQGGGVETLGQKMSKKWPMVQNSRKPYESRRMEHGIKWFWRGITLSRKPHVPRL